MNAWYDRVNGMRPQNNPYQAPMQNGPVPYSGGPMFQNPMQKMQYIMQVMTNPAAFVKQQFPDIPDNILNDPNQVGPYIQKRLGVSNQQVQQIRQNPYPSYPQGRF